MPVLSGGVLPPENIWQDLENFGLFQLGGEVLWHLVGRGQDCCKTFCHVQDRPLSPLQQRIT